MKVEFTFKDGKKKTVDHRVAEALTKLRRGTYETTDLSAVARPIRTRIERVSLEPERNASLSADRVPLEESDLQDEGGEEQKPEASAVDLDAMELPALREHAKSLGVIYHNFDKADKLRSAIREHLATTAA